MFLLPRVPYTLPAEPPNPPSKESPDSTNRSCEERLALEDLAREVPFQMRVSLNVATVYEYVGRIDVARKLFVNLRERLIARGEEGDVPWVLTHLAATAWLAGHLEVAEREATDAVEFTPKALRNIAQGCRIISAATLGAISLLYPEGVAGHACPRVLPSPHGSVSIKSPRTHHFSQPRNGVRFFVT
jgi:hypothetical protein